MFYTSIQHNIDTKNYLYFSPYYFYYIVAHSRRFKIIYEIYSVFTVLESLFQKTIFREMRQNGSAEI